MSELKPCPHRRASDDGQILCERIQSGDRAVAPNICRACPVMAVNCAHLRATLNHDVRPPITVRWGNGKTQIWEPDAPSITLERAACAIKVVPILSPRDCAGCQLRQPLAIANTVVANEIAPVVKRASRKTALAPQQVVAASTAPAPQIVAPQPPIIVAQAAPEPQAAALPPAPDARSTVVHQKIIQLQEWLKQNRTPSAPPEKEAEPVTRVALASARAVPIVRKEERRVGWTD